MKGEMAAAAEPAGLPNGKRQKSAANGHAHSRAAGNDDPSAQRELEMRQAQHGGDGDVTMTG